MNKFHAKRTNGYASGREAKRAAELKLLEKAGEIRGLREQVKFVLIPRQHSEDGKLLERECSYVADFDYEERIGDGWKYVVEDSKGYREPIYRLKRKLLLFIHSIRVRET